MAILVQKDKRRLRGEKTRGKILESARQLFSSQGYHATTTRQIAERAGITSGAIYNHFESKKAIFEALIARYHPWIYIPDAVAEAQGDDLVAFVQDASRRMLAIWRKQPENMHLHLIELIEFQGKHLPAIFEDAFGRMTGILRERTYTNQELSESPGMLSGALLGLFFAYLMTDSSPGMSDILGTGQNAFDYFTDAYLHGVIAKETGGAQSNKPSTD